jgi:hypothetical protein
MNTRVWILIFAFSPWLSSAKSADLDLDWLAGSWCRSSGDLSSEEHWMRNAGGVMLGMSRTITRRGTEFEFVRIEITPNAARYIAMPSGQPQASFELTQAGERSATFANPSHDFPKRIRYWREDQRLFARIDGGSDTAGARTFSWTRCEIAQ